uniref:7TM GPCR serpentine receptor class x (Srx) domain-containing protein n=1 Tax=Panagrellus redivivus TaxID=6233 RepID=A0A7E4W3Y1_PANRE
MSEYRYFVCTFIFWDTIYNISVGFFALPVPLFPAFGFITTGFNEDFVNFFGLRVGKVLWAVIFWCGADLLQLQFFCLLYRFCALHPNEDLRKKFMSWPSMIAFHILGYGLCFSVSIPVTYTVVEVADYPAYMARYNASTFDLIKPGDVYGFLDEESSVWSYFCPVVLALFVMNTVLSLLLSAYIIRMLSQNSKNFSKKTYRLQLQLSFVLVIQIILPLIFVVGPLSVLFIYMVYLKIPLTRTAAYIGVSLLTVYPSLNTLITIVCVTPYRNFTVKWMMVIVNLIKRPCFGKPRTAPSLRSGSLVQSTIIFPD